jgi:hypothetical protein
MRAGKWLMLVGLLGPGASAFGCSGGYPLPPTPCDHLCEVTRGGLYCTEYSPASCVWNCESAGLGDERCRKELDAVIECFGKTAGAVADKCDWADSTPMLCRAEGQALSDCGAKLVYGNNGFQ